jgi:hypothetical protein
VHSVAENAPQKKMSPAADARFSGGPKTDDAQRIKESPAFSPGLPRRCP